jgi:hypothetical protein
MGEEGTEGLRDCFGRQIDGGMGEAEKGGMGEITNLNLIFIINVTCSPKR